MLLRGCDVTFALAGPILMHMLLRGCDVTFALAGPILMHMLVDIAALLAFHQSHCMCTPGHQV